MWDGGGWEDVTDVRSKFEGMRFVVAGETLLFKLRDESFMVVTNMTTRNSTVRVEPCLRDEVLRNKASQAREEGGL